MILIFGLILIILLLILDRKYKSYWLEKGVYSSPSKFLIGSLMNPFSKLSVWEETNECYKKGKSHKMIGRYEVFKPILLLTDPLLIKQLLVKDVDHFVDRRSFESGHDKDKLLASMISMMTGNKWKQTRSVITPIFSSGKMKAMYPLIYKEAQTLVDYCNTAMTDGKSVNVFELAGKYSLNVIQTCAFGMEGESFKEKPSHMFHLVNSLFNTTKLAAFQFMLISIAPKLFSYLGFHFVTPAQIQLNEFVKEIIVERRKTELVRCDFLSYLIEVEKKSKQMPDGTHIIDDDIIAAQVVIFMFAGFETVKNNLTFLIYNIARYTEDQKKLREELMQIDTENGINYQQLQELQYLDAFINETMRVHPGAFFLERCCTKDYKFPDIDVTIPKGMIVSVPIYSLNKDPEYWDEPDEFRPSRFLKENKNSINNNLFLPFGLGPRNCIANRFALLETKIVLAKLISSFDIKLKPGTDLKIGRNFFMYKPEDDSVHILLNPL